jgi:aryl-alcohol dehydrogenase-like predicted oxidoreductase
MLGHHDFGEQKIQKQKDMNKWIMLEGVNFDTAEMYSVPREETYGY